ncbi:MAG: zinc ribbon domain-containing protein [Bacillota bacterium]
MRRSWWIWAALTVLVLTVVGYNLFGYYSYSGYWRSGFYGPMGGMMYWMHGPGGIAGRGFGYSSWNPLWTLFIIGLVVLVIYLLIGNRHGACRGYHHDGAGHGYHHDRGCPNCGRPTEPGWQVCPYCRQPLTWPPGDGPRPAERGERR